MLDRRATPRSRTILGGTISLDKRRSTLDCTVHNLSVRGARLRFRGTALLPDVFDLAITRKGSVHRARMIWRSDDTAGVAFVDSADVSAIPLARVSRMRALEAQDRARRIDDLSEGGA